MCIDDEAKLVEAAPVWSHMRGPKGSKDSVRNHAVWACGDGVFAYNVSDKMTVGRRPEDRPVGGLIRPVAQAPETGAPHGIVCGRLSGVAPRCGLMNAGEPLIISRSLGAVGVRSPRRS